MRAIQRLEGVRQLEGRLQDGEFELPGIEQTGFELPDALVGCVAESLDHSKRKSLGSVYLKGNPLSSGR